MDKPRSPFQIEWRKWADPFKTLLNDYNRNDDFEKNDFGDKEYHGPVVMTPHGAIPVNESNLPSTVFNFWRADTNFIMTRKIEFLINTILGVETYDLITPLRFRIAIGTLFDENDVKQRVTDAVTEYLDSVHGLKKPVETDIEVLAKQYDFFAIIDGPIKQIIHGKTKEEVLDKLKSVNVSNRSVRYSWKTT